MAVTIERARALYDLYTNALTTCAPPAAFHDMGRTERVAIALGVHNGRKGDVFWGIQTLLDELEERLKDPVIFRDLP